MNEDDKTVYVASQQFSALVERMDAIPIYQATDRHGLLEWAAQLKQPQGWDTYLTLGMWEVDQPETIGVQASVAQVRAGGKYVRGFSDHVSIEHDAYVTLEQAVNDLLDEAVEAAKGDLSEDPNTKVPDPFAFAARQMETGA
jgi:hypothetical protein